MTKSKIIPAPVVLLLLLAVLAGGCYKDKSNKILETINELTISDTANATLISINQGDTLRLTPVLTQSLEKSEANLVYEWNVYDNSPTSSYTLPVTVIANSRNLEYKIGDPPFTLGQNYRLTFKVTDQTTGVSSFLFYNLYIANKFGQGWMLLEDKAGSGDFSMILPDGEVVHNVYSDRNAAAPLGRPVKLEITPFGITDGVSPSGKKIYILTENNGIELNYLTLLKKFDYSYLFFSSPNPVKPEYMNWAGYSYFGSLSANMGVVINNGKVHTNLVGGFPGAKKWGATLISPSGGLDYSLAPFVAAGGPYPVAYQAIVYDNAAKRFYSVNNVSGLAAFPASASTVFDMNDVGMDMVYMDSANVYGEYNAIMKDAVNDPYLLRFKVVATTASPSITLVKTAMNAPDVVNMTAAAGSTLTPHIYYSTGNKIVAYETNSNTSADQYTFAAGEVVTAMRYQQIAPGSSSPRLAVATWNGTEGKVYYFPISSLGSFSAYADVFGGFAKIVDMGYKVL